MLITIFTSTYNRAALLSRLYQSIKHQTCTDFEWIIVDDGSTDNTGAVVNGFIAEGAVNIRYIKQQNSGKHRAINRGVKEAKGELFFIVDSDDGIPASAVADIIDFYTPIRNDNTFGGISGCISSFSNDKISSLGADKDLFIDCTSLDIRYKYNIAGDLAEVFRTDVLREIPFPEINGEKFCPEALVWNRIAQKYKLRFYNKAIYQREYQPGGLSHRIVQIRMQNPIAATTHYAELNSYRIPFAQKVKAAINYWRFWYCLAEKSDAPAIGKCWTIVKPLGKLMHTRDCK